MLFGTTIQRMIFAELVRVFLLALVTLTSLFLLAGLVAEATQRGLAPSQILMVIPLLIPNTLPYTVPSTVLFAACVVYGRLAADNEITALKAAGIHLGKLLAPALLLGSLMAAGTMALYWDFIPRTHLMMRTKVLNDIEELIYTALKRHGCLRDPKIEYCMWVRQVQGRRLIDAIFKQRDSVKGGYRTVARAREARLTYDPVRNVLRADMSYVATYGENDLFSANVTDPSFPIQLPESLLGNYYIRRPTDLTWSELMERRTTIADEVREAEEYARNPPPPDPKLTPKEAAEAATAWKNLLPVKVRERNGVEMEIHLRPSLAIGCLVFALVGAPVGIFFSRSDYLSTFVSCFLPTVVTYYPLLMSGMNLAKEGRMPAAISMWAANVVVGVAAIVLYARLLRR